MTNEDLVRRLHSYLHQLGPHQRIREAGTLLLQSLEAIESLRRREVTLTQMLGRHLGEAEAARLIALRDAIDRSQGS
jgi:hypothetical protein